MRLAPLLRSGFLVLVCSFVADSLVAAEPPDVPDSVRIPLETHYINSCNGGFIYKLGIRVGLGGGGFKLYEFDTGASGFYAGYNGKWWKSYKTFNVPFTQKYSSGIEYTGVISTTTVDLGHGIPPIRTNVGMIRDGTGPCIEQWNEDVANGIAPLYQNFFGDFGCALGSGNGLFSILPQLPGNLSSGFAVSTGGNHAPNASVTLGLTGNLRSQFPVLVRMQAGGGSGTFPNPDSKNESRRLYQQELIDATLILRRGGGMVSSPTPVVLDTGAPSMEIHDLGGGLGIPPALIDGKQIEDKVRLSLVASGKNTPSWPLSFRVGNMTGFTEVNITDSATSSHTVPYVNAGLNAFFRYDVMFDVENGVVGFRPIRIGKPKLRVFEKKVIDSEKPEFTVRGSALGGSQLLSHIEYKRGYHGKYRRIDATHRWSVALKLEPGRNRFVFRAVDIAGVASKSSSLVINGN